MNTHRYTSVVFDLDGTLLDTLDDLADSVNTVLEERGWPLHAVDAYRYFVGDGAATLIHRVLPADRRTPEEESICLGRFRAVYAQKWNNKTRPYPGVEDMLAALAAGGVRMAVLSNKPHDATEQCVRELLSGTRFDVIQGQDAQIPKKPAPDGALRIAAMLGVEPREILYLGDTATDMQTAVRAGMVPIGALWGFRTAEELSQHGARRLIRHPAELLPLLDDRTLAP
ncbi:MAG: HAD family hydrolase [Bacteroidetes bacterium]|nr:HAD family hydrolase [Bacteroidota bacterium]